MTAESECRTGNVAAPSITFNTGNNWRTFPIAIRNASTAKHHSNVYGQKKVIDIKDIFF